MQRGDAMKKCAASLLSKATEFMAGSRHPGKDRTRGHFGLAGHNDPVMFRNIAIKILK
jgi:hypothetical protein